MTEKQRLSILLLLIRTLLIWEKILPKIQKRFFNAPDRPVIWNCGSPAEKVPEFLDSHLKNIMKENWSYIKGSNDFINKTKSLKDISKDAVLATVDFVGLYPSIPHEAELTR